MSIGWQSTVVHSDAQPTDTDTKIPRCYKSTWLYARRHILYSYQIAFSGVTPANPNRLKRNFTGKHRVTWHARSANFWRRPPKGCKMTLKIAFCELFVIKTTRRFTHFPADDFHKVWTQNVNRCRHEFFRNRITKFFRKGVTNRSLILRGLGTPSARPPQFWPLGRRRIWALTASPPIPLRLYTLPKWSNPPLFNHWVPQRPNVKN